MTQTRPDATQIDSQLLRQTLHDQYRIVVHSMIHIRTVCGIVDTNGQKYIWKCVFDPATAAPRLAVQGWVAEELQRYGLTASGPLSNRTGEWVSRVGAYWGYLQPWLRGRHSNPLQKVERLRTAAALAWFHQLSAHWEFADSAVLRRMPLAEKLAVKRNFLLQVWESVASRGVDLAGDAGWLLQAANRAVDAAAASVASQYAHRDAAPHNVLVQDDGRVAFIDFDEAGLDDPLVDLMQFTNHGIHLGALAPGYFQDLLDAYGRNHPLPPQRRETVWALFGFPDVLVRFMLQWAKSGWSEERRWCVQRALEVERDRRAVLARGG